MKNKRFSPLALILTAVLTLALTLGAVALTVWLRLGPDGLAVLEGMDLLRGRFVGEYDQSKTVDAMLSAAVDTLDDRWSYYLDPEAYAATKERRKNNYVGVGLTYTVEEGSEAMVIIGLAPGGPAEKAGLKVGDRITAIDGQTITAQNRDALVATIGTQPGKVTTFTVADETGASREVEIRSAEIDTNSVFAELLDDGIGYVRINNFYNGTAQNASAAVDDLVSRGAKALLFDVRYNPGGYVEELTKLLDHLLGEGPIFTERAAGGSSKTIWSDAACVDLPMAVLINGDSYSAAELFAAQLRESVSAPLIGEQTCGKGYYQQLFSLPNGGGLNLSTGLYGTGGGTSLIGVGLEPDVQESDVVAQLERAISLLEERIG